MAALPLLAGLAGLVIRKANIYDANAKLASAKQDAAINPTAALCLLRGKQFKSNFDYLAHEVNVLRPCLGRDIETNNLIDNPKRYEKPKRV